MPPSRTWLPAQLCPPERTPILMSASPGLHGRPRPRPPRSRRARSRRESAPACARSRRRGARLLIAGLAPRETFAVVTAPRHRRSTIQDMLSVMQNIVSEACGRRARRSGATACSRSRVRQRCYALSAPGPKASALGELARAVGLPKSTVHRLVGALTAEQLAGAGAAGQDRARRRPSAPLRQHGLDALPRAAAPDRSRRCGGELDETVDLAVLDGAAACASSTSWRRRTGCAPVSAVGVRFPLHCTANGKAAARGAAGAERASALLPARAAAPTRPTRSSTRAALARELERRCARDGVAFDRRGAHARASARYGRRRCSTASSPVAAISVPVPSDALSRREQLTRRPARSRAQRFASARKPAVVAELGPLSHRVGNHDDRLRALAIGANRLEQQRVTAVLARRLPSARSRPT